MNEKAEYMNFPITLLQGAFKDIKNTVMDILNYSFYKHSLLLGDGDERERMADAATFFNIRLNDIDASIQRGKQIHKSLAKGTGKI